MSRNFFKKLKPTIVLATMTACFCVSEAAYAQNGDDGQYFHRWCDRVVSSLRTALSDGYDADTYGEEEQILLAAINTALNTAKSRHRRYFNYTLKIARQDELIYAQDQSRRNTLLREYINDAIDDLNEIDRMSENEDDAIEYVGGLLDRTISRGERTPTNDQELLILKRGMQRALDLLKMSDYRRKPKNACAAKVMSDALNTIENEALSVHSQITILRSASNRASTITNCGCQD